jgi:hypothetical protein
VCSIGMGEGRVAEWGSGGVGEVDADWTGEGHA